MSTAAVSDADPAARPASAAETFTRWMREHGAALRRVAAAYTRTHAEQDDLAQQVSLALWRALPTFRGECSERTFVFRIAHNQGVQYSTRERPRRAHPEGDSGADTMVDERADPERALDQERRRQRLFEAIRALPVGLRQAITLALEGIGHDEIAAVLGITTNNVDVRLSRAREALRDRLGGDR